MTLSIRSSKVSINCISLVFRKEEIEDVDLQNYADKLVSKDKCILTILTILMARDLLLL